MTAEPWDMGASGMAVIALAVQYINARRQRRVIEVLRRQLRASRVERKTVVAIIRRISAPGWRRVSASRSASNVIRLPDRSTIEAARRLARRVVQEERARGDNFGDTPPPTHGYE